MILPESSASPCIRKRSMPPGLAADRNPRRGTLVLFGDG
jgi:hypothetical protein